MQQTEKHDIRILRDLAARYLEICRTDEQARRRDLWRRHNSLQRTRPPIYVRAVPWAEVPEVNRLECEDKFYRHYEHWLRMMIYRSGIDDDYIYEPWIAVEAVKESPAEGIWGLPVGRKSSGVAGGSWMYDPPIKALSDKNKLVFPHHVDR